jgi:hypothetical protein
MPQEMPPATIAEIAASLQYSLRFGSTGKAHGKRMLADPALLAPWLAQHLLMSNFVILRRPPQPTYQPGNCGQRPTGRDDV